MPALTASPERARLDLVSGAPQEFLVVGIDAQQVVAVLDEDDVALLGVPSGENDGAVEHGAHHAARRRGDVDAGVDDAVVAFGDHALERGEEVDAFDGQVARCARAHAELLFFLDGLLQDGVAAGELCAVFIRKSRESILMALATACRREWALG